MDGEIFHYIVGFHILNAIVISTISGFFSWALEKFYNRLRCYSSISPEVPAIRHGFSGFTLAHNARSKDDVVNIIRRAESAGARVVKEPEETFWGGFSGYFADLDGYYWEVAWGPMFEFTENGELKFKGNAYRDSE